MTISPQEQMIIEMLRELKAFERIEVIKDSSGKMDHYLVHRSQKIVLCPPKIKI